MSDRERHIRQVRIDIPLRTTCAYLFVDPEQKEWDPWWSSLYEYLLKITPNDPDWKYEPVQNVFVARPMLTDEQRADLVRFLRSAPAREIEHHRTLRRAVELNTEKERKLELMYFSADNNKI